MFAAKNHSLDDSSGNGEQQHSSDDVIFVGEETRKSVHSRIGKPAKSVNKLCDAVLADCRDKVANEGVSFQQQTARLNRSHNATRNTSSGRLFGSCDKPQFANAGQNSFNDSSIEQRLLSLSSSGESDQRLPRQRSTLQRETEKDFPRCHSHSSLPQGTRDASRNKKKFGKAKALGLCNGQQVSVNSWMKTSTGDDRMAMKLANRRAKRKEQRQRKRERLKQERSNGKHSVVFVVQ